MMLKGVALHTLAVIVAVMAVVVGERSAAAAATPDDGGVDASLDAASSERAAAAASEDAGPPQQPAAASAPASVPQAERTATTPAATPPPSMATPPPQSSRELPTTELPREDIVEEAFGATRSASKNAWGGYGELTLNALSGTPPGAFNLQTRGANNQLPSSPKNVVDLRRVVFFFGHDFNEQLRFYSEVEFEHAVTSGSDQGEAEIEQAFLDWLPSKKLSVRAGLILWPMGITNIYHEPPSFFGVDRPDVDTVVIPTTWREAGFGFFGEPVEGLRYQLYAGTSFDAHGFNAQYGIRDGHQEGQLAYGGDFSVIGRLDYEPILGTVFGASAFYGTSGNSLDSSVGKVPLSMFDIDARTHTGGFTARAEAAMLRIGDTPALNQSLQAAWPGPGPWNGPVSKLSWGAFAEMGYDVLHVLAPESNQQLIFFDRFDVVDPQASVPTGFSAVAAARRYSDQAGIVYKPIQQIALKADYRRQYLGDSTSYDEIDSAITWLF
jgi:hypothetical protein